LESLLSKFEVASAGDDGDSPAKMNERIESMERNILNILRILEKR
jgi:hypothetical protein